MTFRTIFEAPSSQEFLTWAAVPGLVFVLAGALMVLKPQVLSRAFPNVRGSWIRGSRGKVLSWAWLIFWSVWTATFFRGASHWQSFSQSEPSTVVEGRVTNFVRMPHNGPSNESFVVSDRRFTFSEFVLKAIPEIKDGVYARVTFRERPINRIQILRLEVADTN